MESFFKPQKCKTEPVLIDDKWNSSGTTKKKANGEKYEKRK